MSHLKKASCENHQKKLSHSKDHELGFHGKWDFQRKFLSKALTFLLELFLRVFMTVIVKWKLYKIHETIF